ncbi:MAG: SGNH/GDSL hydrolase family protein [Clostridia bacterium]|nr:SGNH/GDSL hydrolase family protein [Clostridia bacterium]
MNNSRLYGKKITFNGDSICSGAAFAGGYGRIIAERNNMQYQNVAIGGGTVAAETYYDDGRPRHWICRTIDKMDADADFAIIEGGVNDASLFGGGGNPALGTISKGYGAELDDTTFAGAFESMLKQLLIRFHGKKMGYIAVHKMTRHFSSEYKGEDNFYLTAKLCCEKWGVPFLDLNITVPPFAYFTPEGDPELYAVRQAYTNNGDGWHPNEAGYRKYYCDKIEAWLKTL